MSAPLPKIAIVAALARNRIIGRLGRLPWRLSGDLRRFKALTLGHPVIMGRKTYDSIREALGGPLPERDNIVISRSTAFTLPGCYPADSIEAAIAIANRQAAGGDAFVIGGAEIYRLALPMAVRMHLTEIEADFDGDAVFPPFSRDEWSETLREPGAAEAGLRYSFATYVRR